MNAKLVLRNSTTASAGRSRAFSVKLRMSRNITQILRMSPVNSGGLSNRRSTTDGDTCWPKSWYALARDRLFDGASELRAQPERDQPGYHSGNHHERGLDDMVRVGGYSLKREDPTGYP